MEKVIIVDAETKKKNVNFRYFHILKYLEEKALRDYDLARKENDFQMVMRAKKLGLTRADKQYKAMKVFNETELGKKLARIVKERKKNLKERDLLFLRGIDSIH